MTLLIAGWVGREPVTEERPKTSGHRAVRVTPVATPELSDGLPFSGLLQAVSRVEMAFEIAGRIDSRGVEIGSTVRRGDLLAQLESLPLVNSVTRARAGQVEASARLGQLQRETQRLEGLVSQGAATEEEAERIASALAAASAAYEGATVVLEEAERLRESTELIAPFAGRVDDVFVEPGERLAAGQRVLALSGSDAIEVMVSVPESVIGSVDVGTPVRVIIPIAEKQQIEGVVSRRGQAARGSGRLFPVTIAIPPSLQGTRLLPGMSAEVYFPVALNGELVVPLAAVVNPGASGTRVVRVREGRAERVPVVPLRLAGPSVVVRGDLKLGDLVVVAGGQSLVDGEFVEVIP